MTKALLFGAIGTLLETSDLQRRAFNQAFSDAGLDWNWDEEFYQAQLVEPGGRDRVNRIAAERGETVDAAELHRLKTVHFGKALAEGNHQPRTGVLDMLRHAREQGWKTGFVTTTSRDNIDSVLAAIGNTITREDFDFIGSRDRVDAGKPAPDIYQLALQELGVDAGSAIAIEDSQSGVEAANAAGIRCIAFPGANTKNQDYSKAAWVTDVLHPDQLQHALTASRADISQDFGKPA